MSHKSAAKLWSLLLILGLLAAACGSASDAPSEGPGQSHADHDERPAVGHTVDDEAHDGGPVPLVSLGSPLFRRDLDDHDGYEDVILGPIGDQSTGSAGGPLPLVATGSPLLQGPIDLEETTTARLAPLRSTTDNPAAATANSGAARVAPPPANRHVGPPPLRPAVSPPVAALASTRAGPVPSPSPALSQTVLDTTVIRGRVESSEDRVLTVRADQGLAQVEVSEGASFETDGPGSVGDLRPGQFLGALAQPGAAARFVRTYARGPAMPEAGVVPMTGSEQGSVMTYGTVLAVHSRVISLDTGGQITQIALQPNVEVVKPVHATIADARPGAYLVAVGRKRADGAVSATSVSVRSMP